MAKAIIVYSTRTGDTRKIAEFVAEGLRFSAIDVKLAEAKDIKKESDLNGYDIYVFGSSTYHGEMMPAMKTFLFLAEKAELQGKAAGSFGAFGWSGEAAERIFDTMKNIFGMDMVSIPLMLKSGDIAGGIKMAQDYGRELAKKIA
ncbi:MAG: flavodoxin domain-containing protein [Proteobacteria bacterium]|nr:flavodoxin domain-containing protein [Pseudomonadota bacterium]